MTRLHPSVHAALQYTSSIQAEALKKHVIAYAAARGRTLSRKQCNMRLAAEAESTEFTGFEHNAVRVCPVCGALALALVAATDYCICSFRICVALEAIRHGARWLMQTDNLHAFEPWYEEFDHDERYDGEIDKYGLGILCVLEPHCHP